MIFEKFIHISIFTTKNHRQHRRELSLAQLVALAHLRSRAAAAAALELHEEIQKPINHP